MKTLNLGKGFAALVLTTTLSIFVFTACNKDNNDTGGGTSTTTIKVTDAPIDDASVTGAFVTIADIKLDGQSVQGFTKTTVDIKAFQNGNTSTLGTFNLQGKTYNTITFVLDYDMDASGGSPGSYVVTTGGVKHKLQSTSNEITVSKSLSIIGGLSYSIIADFDLRKMIVHQSGTDHYEFATASELATSIRVMGEGNTGTISGTLTDPLSGSAKVVAYAYKKGTFNRATEMQGQGASNVQFKNAVSSSLVASGTGNYSLHFMESGDYEVHFASYKDTNSDGEFELVGTLVVTGAAGIDLLNLKVNAGATLTASGTVTAVLP